MQTMKVIQSGKVYSHQKTRGQEVRGALNREWSAMKGSKIVRKIPQERICTTLLDKLYCRIIDYIDLN
jgi:hypothetical protein